MTARIFFWSLTSSLAGFLFGFDTVVISGAEQSIEKLWELDKWTHGLAMSMALWGTVLGALGGGWPTDRFGRKKTLVAIGILYLVSAVWSALATGVGTFMIARFIGGIGVGVSTIAAPLFIAEIAPASLRGRLTGMFQFNIVFGILIAYLSNALLGDVGDLAWRWMLGVEAIPALIYGVLCFGLPESPRWLISRRGDREAGAAVLRQIHPELPEERISAKADEIRRHAEEPANRGGFWTKRLRIPILLAFLVAFFNQLSGINAVLYFAPRIFEQAGIAENASRLNTLGIGFTNLIFTFVGLSLIDRLGRRTLLYLGSVGYIVSLGLTSWAFFTGNSGLVPYFIFAFIAAHAVGQGAVIWVFIAEIFPNRHRAEGQALGCGTHWICAALITQFLLPSVETFSYAAIFGFFCFMMVLQLLWVKFMVPETKGVPLEELEEKLGLRRG